MYAKKVPTREEPMMMLLLKARRFNQIMEIWKEISGDSIHVTTVDARLGHEGGGAVERALRGGHAEADWGWVVSTP